MANKTFLTMKKVRTSSSGLNKSHYGSDKFAAGAVATALRQADRTQPAYGIELELPCSGSLQREALTSMDKLPIDRKPDGSLGRGDIEFVFPPLSINQWRMSKLFDQFVAIYERHFARERQVGVRYGLHVHTNVHEWAVPSAMLVKGLIKSNANFFCWVAGRIPYDGLSQQDLPSGHPQWGNRSTAGWQSGYNTIEYRIFDATTDKRRVLSWLQFLEAIEMYVRSPEVVTSFREQLGVPASVPDRNLTCGAYVLRQPDSRAILSNWEHTIRYGSPTYQLVFTPDIANNERFRNYLRSPLVKRKFPLVHAAYAAYNHNATTRANHFSGPLAYTAFLENYYSEVTANAPTTTRLTTATA